VFADGLESCIYDACGWSASILDASEYR